MLFNQLKNKIKTIIFNIKIKKANRIKKQFYLFSIIENFESLDFEIQFEFAIKFAENEKKLVKLS
jgi:hypothetical protein